MIRIMIRKKRDRQDYLMAGRLDEYFEHCLPFDLSSVALAKEEVPRRFALGPKQGNLNTFFT